MRHLRARACRSGAVGPVVFLVVGLAVGLLNAGAALAGTFQISPLRIALSASAPTAVLKVHNPGAAAGVMQLSLMAWSQAGGEDHYLPTQEVLVTPPIFTLAPGASQIVRLALRRRPDARREIAYRLFLQEVPSTVAPAEAPGAPAQAIAVALRFAVPVFVAAAAAPPAHALDWRVVAEAQGGWRIEARNRGGVHVQVAGFALTGADGTLLARHQGMAYLLPDQAHEWRVTAQAGAPPGTRCTIVAQTDAGELHAQALLEP